MGHAGISSESSRRPLSNDIKFARESEFGRGSYGSRKSGYVGAVFACTFPAKIPVKRGMLSANREFHVVAGVIIFPTHPGSRINLLRAGKTLRAKAAVGSCAAYFCKVPDSRESELGLVRYGPANRVHRGVFGPFEGSFPIRIPADPDKFLAIREFHVVHGCVFFPMCPGSQINLLRVRKTLCASVATSVGKFRKFQHSLISSACFHARGRRSSRCRISTILVSSESLRYLLFNGTQALHRGELGFARYDLANRRPSECSLCQGGWSVRSSFWSGQRSGQTLVKLGQPWSNLVEFGQSSPNSGKCIPDRVSRVSGHRWALVGSGNGLVNPWSNLVNPGQTLVNPSQTWSNLGKCVSDLLLGSTAKNLPQFRVISVRRAGQRLTHGSKVKISRSGSPFALSELGSGKIGIRDLSKSQFGEIRRFGNPESKQVGRIWDLKFVPILNWAVQRCPIGVVVAEIIASPHALDSCECMNIKDAMRAPSRWLLLCLSGSECTHIPYFRLSYLVGKIKCAVRPMDKSKNSSFPDSGTVTDLGGSARGVHSPG
uniref:Uncharacterized protein n=1 Tax=Fagus sylvatica TaxID=28930 RepID=A0A2N9FAA6_FAGSY